MKLNIFIDGSWLLHSLSVYKSKMAESSADFCLDFEKLSHSILEHVKKTKPDCNGLGDRHIAISIFKFAVCSKGYDLSYWDIPLKYRDYLQRGVKVREELVLRARKAGFSDRAVLTRHFKNYMLAQLENGTFQEKQVDSTLVALMVRTAVQHPADVHVVITGDSDILPAFQEAFVAGSRLVGSAMNRGDSTSNTGWQSSNLIARFPFEIPIFYLNEHVYEFTAGKNVYECGSCQKIFIRPRPIPATSVPTCKVCYFAMKAIKPRFSSRRWIFHRVQMGWMSLLRFVRRK